jgi:Fic family protein
MHDLMAYRAGHEVSAVNKESVQNLLRNKPYPVITAGDVAEEFDVSNQYANRKLKQLVQEGYLERRKVGGAAAVYWSDESGA